MEVISPLDRGRWSWGGAPPPVVEHRGRRCVRLSSDDGARLVTVAGTGSRDGVLEADVCVPAARSFHGLIWRAVGRNYESFFCRPHQVGFPDAIQYTPVCNGMSCWQLYHGPGFWNAVRYPIGDWFTIRVAFADSAALVHLDGDEVLQAPLRLPATAGAFGVIVGGEDLMLAELRFAEGATVPQIPDPPADPRAVASWEVSDPFPEADIGIAPELDGRTWATLEAEPSGLANLSRLHPVDGERNTVYARATIRSDRDARRRIDFGFSDRAVVFLNGVRLYRGDATYRSWDHRFLGSIGWHDSLDLPLVEGANELVVAVSEDFGGWGVQARFPG
ncbi:MAG TPA: hypothetical protein VK646_04590 [Actinomycetota bacterium]|nr:hypothetical protein [Actinomycetota bacterium]